MSKSNNNIGFWDWVLNPVITSQIDNNLKEINQLEEFKTAVMKISNSVNDASGFIREVYGAVNSAIIYEEINESIDEIKMYSERLKSSSSAFEDVCVKASNKIQRLEEKNIELESQKWIQVWRNKYRW